LKAAAVLNVSADHLDRYASVAAYALAKSRIFARAATVVLNADDPLVAAMRDAVTARSPAARIVTFSVAAPPAPAGAQTADYALLRVGTRTLLAQGGEALLDVARLKIAGLHNAANALAALALGDAISLPRARMIEALESFPGLPHRSEWVAEVAGVRFIDDSKGTNVGATMAAVAGMPGPLVMIAGGQGKGQDFTPLADAFRGKVRHAVLIGEDAPQVAAALEGVCSLERAGSMQDAVIAAARAARAGDTVLLSPACASLDMFRDYAQRGDVFAAAVRSLASVCTPRVSTRGTSTPGGRT
jgi:UDP-N-acetylmuramoylalanine--D-glutamate ligase